MSKKCRLLLVLALITCAAPACAPVQPAVPTPALPTHPAPAVALASNSPVLALVGGTLVDGTGAEPVPGSVVLVQDGKILAAGPSDRVAVPEGAKIIDTSGGTVLPGFINAHVHEGFDPKNLEAWAAGGVTTVRDEGAFSCKSLKTLLDKRQADLNKPKYARIVSAGCIITRPSGYGGLFVSSIEEARQVVFDELDSGVDLIKISEEDGYAGRSGLPKLSMEELQAVIAAAHERGARVSGHITQARYWKMLVEAGVDDVAHLSYDPVDPKVVTEMVKKGISITPTFSVFKDYGALGSTVDNLRLVVEAGGKVALGNDYAGGRTLDSFELGIPMFEIEMMQKAGMSPMQIILAATLSAAEVCGRDKDLGTLEPGKLADVLVIKGDPLADLQALKNVWMVFKGGEQIR